MLHLRNEIKDKKVIHWMCLVWKFMLMTLDSALRFSKIKTIECEKFFSNLSSEQLTKLRRQKDLVINRLDVDNEKLTSDMAKNDFKM